MHADLIALFNGLESARVAQGLSREDVENTLVLGPGWVELFESGKREPSLGALAALLTLYDVKLSDFFQELELSNEGVIPDRHLSVEPDGDGIYLHFPMGAYDAKVRFSNASIDEYNDVLLVMRNRLAAGQKKEAIVDAFMKAVHLWPHLNPSDLWYFFISHAYQDDYNHPATSAGLDWSQSWKRAGGWSLEAVYVKHYNSFLAQHGIELLMPDPATKKGFLGQMGIAGQAGVEKSDVIAVGRNNAGDVEPFGVIHVKASFAERRTDDVPLSRQLIQSNYASPLLTMDCKAAPREQPINKGELGPVQDGTARVSSKRLDIERDRVFDAAFSYNSNTFGTPQNANAASRIHVCNFSDPDDAFSRYLVRKWNDRQGIS